MSTSTLVTIAELHEVIRLRTFHFEREDVLWMLGEIVATLQCEGVTGKLIVNFNQGGVGSFQFEERAKIHRDATNSVDNPPPA